ncbi:LOW QUALITY PROTEIN: hypothetical protein Cgig2_013902 [Carnegiea gigantea]|uniref:SWIM-type domain-containing protein n=1 Tax=Carnegiea gigantea TaxID=171969 RepID=A0A9Q1JWI3_9CARY|nr:LOW QUALITY PROTEIN: hypothetical protein Cgig2_013902 [Carnegiea gigantea]
MSVYTVEAFLMFEKEFIDGAGYNFKVIESSSRDMSFEVWGIRFARESHGEELYEFRHIVNFNKEEGVIECSCQMFSEVGILCSHCLRVLHACCVEHVPDRYIIKRQCKGIKDGHSLESLTGEDNVGCSSVWKMQMLRKMNSIITVSQMNKNARAHCKKAFLERKELVEFDVGSINCDKHGNVKVLSSLPNVLNPPGSRQKGVRNKRFKSIVERKCDEVKRRKSKKLSKNDVGSSTAPSQNGSCISDALPHTGISYSQMLQQGSFHLPSSHPTYYFHSADSSSVFMPVMASPVL